MNLFVRFETLRAPSFLRAPRGALRPSMAEGGTKGDTKGSANDASRHIGGTKSTFGPQPMSTRTSPAIYGYGSSTREDREKVFVSHEHAALACDSSRSPGPIYNHLPAIGPQPTGTFSSAPTWVFGSSEQRPSAENKSLLENPAPGKYDMERSIGVQHESKKETQPRYGFGTGTREHREKVFVSQEHTITSDYGKASPGPAAPYRRETAILEKGHKHMLSYSSGSIYGHGPTSRVRNATQPAWVMGTAERFTKDSTAYVPGPGQYAIKPAVGPQADSKLHNAPRFGFGTGTREHREKVFVSHEHSKTEGSRDAPGPGQYPMPALTGKPVKAGLQKSGAAWGFGSSKRFSDFEKERAPGPGYYVI